ncbi:unnamed protein product [Amoebophrya sp. A120]|nr:unnamed protein product [Amoebophrya sp. A120]|eukprot:GSA120T00021482001.1
MKRKRLGKVKTNKVSLKDIQEKRQKQAEKELKKTAKQIEEARAECAVQKRRKQNAPAPIAKRKNLGYDSVSAGARVEFEKNKRERKLQRKLERKKKKENVQTGGAVEDDEQKTEKTKQTEKKRKRQEQFDTERETFGDVDDLLENYSSSGTTSSAFASLLKDVIQ